MAFSMSWTAPPENSFGPSLSCVKPGI
jgi:outer membrane protein assembly factor BamB